MMILFSPLWDTCFLIIQGTTKTNQKHSVNKVSGLNKKKPKHSIYIPD